jgi:hypothetical protein
MKTFGVLALIVAALCACQSSGGGTASLNASYPESGSCSSSYDYSNTGAGSWCLGRQWH